MNGKVVAPMHRLSRWRLPGDQDLEEGKAADEEVSRMMAEPGDIQAALDTFFRAFDDLDWERFAPCWSADPTAFFPGDKARLDGRAAVLTRFRAMFDQLRARSVGPPYLHLTPRDLRIDRYGDAVLVTFTLPDTPGPIPLRSLLFVREAGAWKLAHAHATNQLIVASR